MKLLLKIDAINLFEFSLLLLMSGLTVFQNFILSDQPLCGNYKANYRSSAKKAKRRILTGVTRFSFHFISLTLFSVGLINSYSKITNKYQLKQKCKTSVDYNINF